MRVDTALGFVFVCLARRSAAGRQDLGQTRARNLRRYRLEEMVPLAPISSRTCGPVDWKIAMDNYLESYHVPIGHPGLYRMFTPDYEDQPRCRASRAA